MPVDDMSLIITTEGIMLEAILSAPPVIKAAPGQIQYVTPGTYSWKVPDGVKSICAVCIGTGSHAVNSNGYYGGMGGALRWANNIPVTPGETLTITVVAASASLGYTTGVVGYVAGGDTVIRRGTTVLLKAAGGRQTKDEQIADSVGVGGGNGGERTNPSANTTGVPGSGTGGYFGDGGGTTVNAKPTDTTAGASGTTSSNTVSGVNISGGNNGIGAFLNGEGGSGTRCGGGGAASRRSSDNARAYSSPGNGGCRIIWGTDRSYPSNALDVTA